MKKSRNIKNLRDFLKNKINSYIENNLNRQKCTKIVQVVEFKRLILIFRCLNLAQQPGQLYFVICSTRSNKPWLKPPQCLDPSPRR